MFIASCPLRVSLFGGSTDNPFFVEKYGYGSVISFACNLKTYITLHKDKLGYNQGGKYRFGDTRHIWSDISKLQSLGWEPQRTIYDSIIEYKEWLGSASSVDNIIEYCEKKMKELNVLRDIS